MCIISTLAIFRNVEFYVNWRKSENTLLKYVVAYVLLGCQGGCYNCARWVRKDCEQRVRWGGAARYADTSKLRTEDCSKRVTVYPQFDKQTRHGPLVMDRSAAVDVAGQYVRRAGRCHDAINSVEQTNIECLIIFNIIKIMYYKLC